MITFPWRSRTFPPLSFSFCMVVRFWSALSCLSLSLSFLWLHIHPDACLTVAALLAQALTLVLLICPRVRCLIPSVSPILPPLCSPSFTCDLCHPLAFLSPPELACTSSFYEVVIHLVPSLSIRLLTNIIVFALLLSMFLVCVILCSFLFSVSFLSVLLQVSS